MVVDVTVKDKSGNPIKGLKPADFNITEDGKKQDIKIFTFQELEETVNPEPVPAKAAPAPRRRPPDAPPAPAAPVVKSVTANQIAPSKPGEVKYKDRRLLVMFFDMTSMPIQDQIRAQTAAQKFLKTQMTPSDLMAIMTFSSDLKVLQDFTDDRDALAKVIKGLTIGEGSDLAVDGSTGADNEEDTGAAFTADDTEFNIFNTDRKLAALESAARMLGALPEKKALVYFASGVSKTGVDNEAQLRGTINAAIRNNVAFFPIDARGLVASAPLGDATKGSPGGSGMYSRQFGPHRSNPACRARRKRSTRWPPTPAARPCSTTTISAWASSRRRRKSPATTSSATTASNDKLDGRYRRIKLQPTADLQAKIGKIDYRQGYFAGKEFGKFNSSDKERQLQEALMLGDPMTDLSVALEVDYFRMARDRYFVPVTVKIPGCGTGTGPRQGRRKHQARFHRRSARCQRRRAGQRPRLPGDQTEGRERRHALQAHPGLRHGLYPAARHLHPQVPRARKRNRQDGDLRNQIRDSGSHHPGEVPADFERRAQQSAAGSERRAGHRREATRDCSPPTRWCRTTRSWCPA